MTNDKPFEWNETLFNEWGNYFINNKGSWNTLLAKFKESKKIKEQPIKIIDFIFGGINALSMHGYTMLANDVIPKNKYPLIIEVIENVLNNVNEQTPNPILSLHTVDKDKEETKEWEVVAYGPNDRIYIPNVEPYIELSNNFKSPDYKILSVKRLSDGEVFTIGDEIGWGYKKDYKTTLTGFIVDNGRLKFTYPTCAERPCDFFDAIDLHKKEQTNPLFTTEDGQEVHTFKDFVWTVATKRNYHLLKMNSKQAALTLNDDSVGLKTFSTEQQAKEYIYKNKPTFSKENIRVLVKALLTHNEVMWKDESPSKFELRRFAESLINTMFYDK